MCDYCYLKRIKKKARRDGNKIVITQIDTGGYEAKVRRRNWRPPEVEGEYVGFDIHLIFPTLPERCTCPSEDMDNPLPIDMTTRCQLMGSAE